MIERILHYPVAQTCVFSFLSHFGGRSCFFNLILLLARRAISFTHLLTPSERDDDDALKLLEKVYVRPKNNVFARHLLATRRPNSGETID